MKRALSILFVLSMIPSLVAFAGVTGKLRGKVIDDKTKEPLIGANVVIVGTNYGAATDVNGNYILLNVPSGTYSVRSSLLGYQSVLVNNVKISEDLSTELNFKLISTEVELKEVVIVQERPLVNKNATNAVRIGNQEDINKLPVRGVVQAVVLSPGVVQQNGNVYIRGGRNDEVGYYLEGATTRNVVNGQNLTTVIPEALEEFQVQAGGYTAEYGGANAGIVRQTLRSGTSQYKASVQLETDNFTDQYKKRFGTYSYGYSNYVATLSGPIIDNVKFFLAGENEFQRDTQVRFWPGFTMYNLPNNQTPKDTVAVLDIQPGNIPGALRNRYTLNGTVTFDFNPYVFRLGGAFTTQRQKGTADPIGNYFNLGRLGITQTSNMLLNAKFTHLLSSSTLYEVNVNYGDNRNKTFDPDLGDNYLTYSDSIANAKYGYPFRSYVSGPYAYDLYKFPFSRYGALLSGYNKGKQIRWGGSIDLTSQVNTIHQLKVGASIDYYKISNFNINAGSTQAVLLTYRQDPDLARTPGLLRDFTVAKQGNINNYGYDFYGNEITDPNNIDGPKTPTYVGAYIEDKIEYSDLVVNAGVRLDYIDNSDIQFVDDPSTPQIEGPNNPAVDVLLGNSYPIYKASGIKKAKAFTGVSPRLGFSFPVSDRTVFHLQWGKFIQAPSLGSIYVGRGFQAVIFGGQNFIPNPNGYNIQPERTTQYEVGFTQQFTENAAFDITGFYKDISGQLQIQRILTSPDAEAKGYNAYVNGDFVTTKGIELSLRLRRINRIRAQINYTFSDAQGTGSTTNSAVSSVESGTLYPTVISPLDFNQAHRGSINVDYSFDKGDGGPILEQLGVNLLFTFNSGHNYTKSTGSIGQQGASTGALVESDARFSNPLESVNASTTPWNYTLDLRVYKDIAIAGLNTEFYIYVQNLLNTQNVLNVYRRTGNAYDDGFLNNPDLSSGTINQNGPGYVQLYTNANILSGRAYRNVTGNNLFGTPRQIRFGLRLEL